MREVTCHLFHEPVEITHALVAVASQEGNDGPEYDLMMAAAERIRFLESLLDIQSFENCINDWINTNKDMPPEFMKIVEDNFWELLA